MQSQSKRLLHQRENSAKRAVRFSEKSAAREREAALSHSLAAKKNPLAFANGESKGISFVLCPISRSSVTLLM